MKRVVVIAEDYDRTLVLLKELDKLGVQTVLWNVTTGSLLPCVPPEDAVYFCRQSPSSGTRGHQSSIPYVRNVLWWLKLHKVTVINGLGAFEMEMSKSSQMALLHARGVNTPHTRLVVGSRQLWVELNAAAAYPPIPVIIKPDTGGSGVDIKAYPNASQAAMHIWQEAMYNTPAAQGSMWIIQEHVNQYTEDETRMRSILRFEIVDGKVLYIVQIRAPATDFKLCPCDPKMESMMSKIEFRIILDPYSIPCFRDHPDTYTSFVGKIEGVWRELDSSVGSVEAFMPVEHADDYTSRAYSDESTKVAHEPVVFEMNFNSNYNQKAEDLAGVNGAVQVAKMLERAAKATPMTTTTPPPEIIDL